MVGLARADGRTEPTDPRGVWRVPRFFHRSRSRSPVRGERRRSRERYDEPHRAYDRRDAPRSDAQRRYDDHRLHEYDRRYVRARATKPACASSLALSPCVER
jgi:hypothetical protein